jgi:exodeoxyribonuclease VII large subunit
MSREVQHDGARSLEVRFPFDRELVDLIKTLPRRRWIATGRFWQVPEDDVVSLVDLLSTHSFRFDAATCALYGDRGGTATLESPEPVSRGPLLPGLFDDDDPATAASGSGDYTVSQLNREVRQAIEAAFPQPVWLVGEISGFNRNAHKRHVSFQLAEHDEGGKIASSIDATLFDRTRAEIEAELRAAGDPFRLEDEVTVRLRARVDLYVPWGSYRVVVEEIDVRYTLGEAARRREEIIRQLTEEGLVGVNSALALPPVPLRVALVTSIGSDAYNDVLRTLQESGFAFEITVHGARVQGRATEPSVLNALDALRPLEPDVVLVCRGGGSRTDLAWFDTLALGRAVARYPLPIVVGIGHEQDHSVLDAVGRRTKTPTAAAALVVDRVRGSLERLENSGRQILELAGRRLREQKRVAAERGRRLVLASRGALDRELAELGHRRRRTGRAAHALLAAASERLARWTRDIPRAGTVLLDRRRDVLDASRRGIGPRTARIILREQERSGARARRLTLVHPRRVLERGYAIVRSEEGNVVTRAEAAPAGSVLHAELARGRLRLRSEGPLPDEGGE